ncbi:putative sulfate exporter family transporter [Aerococcaceae bacterium DSM 111022]|nr:putative sulfate exporter family transporter [Aerococcaceae bacterium DSM 111022]
MPIFVVLFVAAVIFATVVPLSESVTSLISRMSKLLMTLALVSIGFGVHIDQIKKAGIKPVIIGGITWGSVVTVVILLIKLFY